MRYLLVLCVFALACNQNADKKADENKADSIDHTIGDNPANTKPDSVSMPGPDIYEAYIPAKVRDYLAQYMSQWTFPKPDNWEKYWWDQYKKDSNLVNFVSADFNCDGKEDYAVVLRNYRHVGTWALLARDDGFESVRLDHFENKGVIIGMGLEVYPKGEHTPIDLDNPKPKSITLKCDGVNIVYFEKAARAFYWENGKVKRMQTSD